jgi:transposase
MGASSSIWRSVGSSICSPIGSQPRSPPGSALTRESRSSRATEFVTFANGVTADIGVVRAALEYEWSQGQVEGQVHRLKLIKRQMYGRGNLDLLRARVLYAA